MLDAMSRILSRVRCLSLFVGGQHHVYRKVAVGVNAYLESRAVHFHYAFLGLLRRHCEYAMIVLAAHVWLGQVRSSSCYRSVGHHLDATDAKFFISESCFESSVAKGREVIASHQHIYANR